MDLIGSGRPRMVSVQSEGCAPMSVHSSRETGSPSSGRARTPEHPVFGSLLRWRLPDPGLPERIGRHRGRGERRLHLRDADVRRTHRVGYVSPESAAALAAVPVLRDGGEIGRDDKVIVFDCGIGQKYSPPRNPPRTSCRRPRRLDI